MSNRPGKGWLGWLGRQVGYISRAARADVGATVVYRNRSVEEKKLPDRPDVVLRRTTIDEVVRQSPRPEAQRPPSRAANNQGAENGRSALIRH